MESSYNPKQIPEKNRPRHSQMGIHTSWKLHSQGGIHSSREIPQSSERWHLDNYMEIKNLAQNLYFPLASTPNKILTWDNLQRFGFIGPSICYLCHLEVETMEHLLNNSPFSENIWNQATLFMRRTK
jgi:hypothetical protein